MRNAFAAEIEARAERDPRIVLLSGDIGNRMFDRFKSRWPDRFYNCGVAEANMVGVAAGLALMGLRPACYTIAPFLVYRAFEQIRVDLCYQRLPVTIVGVGGGLCYASLGGTHHSCEDIAVMRALPGMTVFCPGDPMEVRGAYRATLDLNGPSYLRLGKKGEPTIHDTVPDLALGEPLPLRTGRDLAILVTGNLLPEAIAAANLLIEQEGLSASVLSCPTVKPLPLEALARLFAGYPLVVTLEEHSRLGGLGGAVAEWLATCAQPPRATLLSLGTEDAFPHQVVDQGAARVHNELTGEAVARSVMRRRRGARIATRG